MNSIRYPMSTASRLPRLTPASTVLAALTLGAGLLLGSQALASTDENLNREFATGSTGKLVVDAAVGSIEVVGDSPKGVRVEIHRRIDFGSTSKEEEYRDKNLVELGQDGDTVRVKIPGQKGNWSWTGKTKLEVQCIVHAPAGFATDLKTGAGAVTVSYLSAPAQVKSSAGALKLSRLTGNVTANTDAGAIRASDCQGELELKTGSGSIDVHNGSGSLKSQTSAGSVTVKKFSGPAHIRTGAGAVTLENVAGKLDAQTRAGGIEASLAKSPTEPIELETSAGGITLKVPEKAAFALDASTSAGSVSCKLPVSPAPQKHSNRVEGTVNGGTVSVRLHSGAGGIRIRTED